MQLALGGSNPTMLTFWIRYGAYPTLGPVSISCTSTAVSGAVTTTYESFYTGTLPTPISAANTWYQENLPLSGGSWDANFSSMNWTNLNTVKFYNYYP
jgi:hypothetical protein